ncbi:CHAT domain-containing protein [Archangium violaceum]|uniref:CHAT domain-containing protein n=1 Tax=Archangium violaceum TaxID=83451 RepID=UPI0036D7604B
MNFNQTEDPLALFYLILFDDNVELSTEAAVLSSGEVRQGGTTLPHGFDLDVVPVLPAIDYCLQLPRTLTDTVEASLSSLYKSRDLDLPHDILVAPASLFRNELIPEGLLTGRPTLILCSRQSAPLGLALVERTRAPLGMALFDELCDKLRVRHWSILSQLPAKSKDGTPYARLVTSPPELPAEMAAQNILPSLFDAHRMKIADQVPMDELRNMRGAHGFRLHLRSFMYSFAELELLGLSEGEIRNSIEGKLKEARRDIVLPVAIGLPGVPRKYQKAAYGKKFKPADSDLELERGVIRQCVTHRALATGGIGIMTQDVPEDVFQALAAVEKHVISAPRTNPAAVWRLLGHISRRLHEVIGVEGLEMLQRANRVQAFSNFPIGLMRLPEHSAPLLCVTPVSIRPVLPLTRALQMEMPRRPYTYWKSQLRVLIAECLEPEDKIRGLSEVGWQQVKEGIERVPGAVCVIQEFKDPQSLARELEENEYDALIISAHGVYDPGRSAAGLKFSTGMSVGLELGKVPPLVILSACHSSPRGVAAVNIGDLLLRQGALAVLGTLVPIDVRKNALLMVRLFTYVAESIKGVEKYRTIEDVWCHVVASNAFNEIMDATERLRDVLTSGTYEDSVLVEFMMRRSRGRLRRSHVYEDTEAVLLEIARERGFERILAPVIESKSYFPESLFYTMIGRPDRIVISDPLTDAVLKDLEMVTPS